MHPDHTENEPHIDWDGAIGPTLIFGVGHRIVLSREEQLRVKQGITDAAKLAQKYRQVLLLRSLIFNKK